MSNVRLHNPPHPTSLVDGWINSSSLPYTLDMCSRRLITMQKVGPYNAAATAAYYEAAGPPLMAIDTVHETVRLT